MSTLAALWDEMESPLRPTPDFPVQDPDGARQWSEIDRQAMLLNLIRSAAPRVKAFPIPNAGKRNPAKARKEGIMGGVFDLQFCWMDGLTAFVEMKGYDARGRAGELSNAQIDWGNDMMRLGHRVACFFDPYAALSWLRDQGFPVRKVGQ